MSLSCATSGTSAPWSHLHNFTSKPRAVVLDGKAVGGQAGPGKLVDLLALNDSQADESGRFLVELQPYDYRWLRVGGIDVSWYIAGPRSPKTCPSGIAELRSRTRLFSGHDHGPSPTHESRATNTIKAFIYQTGPILDCNPFQGCLG